MNPLQQAQGCQIKQMTSEEASNPPSEFQKFETSTLEALYEYTDDERTKVAIKNQSGNQVNQLGDLSWLANNALARSTTRRRNKFIRFFWRTRVQIIEIGGRIM